MREYTHNRGVPPAAWQGPSLKITQKPTREIYRKDVALTPFAGKVRRVLVSQGQAVVAGQPLVEMDTTEAQARRREAQAAVSKAQTAYDQLAHWSESVDIARSHRSLARSKMALDSQQKTLEENSRLFAKGIISKSEVDFAQQQLVNQQMDYQTAQEELKAAQDRASPRQIAAMKNELDNASARLAQVEQDLAHATVLAPVAGVVMRPIVSGNGGKEVRTPEPGVAFAQGEALLSIGDLSGLAVRARADELDVLRLRPGLPAQVRAEAFAGQTLVGTLQSIAPLEAERDAGASGAVSLQCAWPCRRCHQSCARASWPA
jgi:multidrug resistance efflux pump